MEQFLDSSARRASKLFIFRPRLSMPVENPYLGTLLGPQTSRDLLIRALEGGQRDLFAGVKYFLSPTLPDTVRGKVSCSMYDPFTAMSQRCLL